MIPPEPYLGSYVDRSAVILERCRGRRVLHLGCVGFTDCPPAEKVSMARNSLHQKLTDISDCVGVDIDRSTVEQLKDAGVFKNILVGDAEQLQDLPLPAGSFEIVLAGDIIEHLSNPGRMLEGARHHLKPSGLLVVSTPNSMGLPAYLRYLTGHFREGLQHVLCFNPITLSQLLHRQGYEIVECFSCYQSPRQSLSFRLSCAFFRRFPKLGGTLLYIARPSSCDY